jgi:uncharacterized protein (TIGR02001 family)
MKTTNKLALLAASAIALSAGAQAGDVTFNLGVTSDYKFRGQSQSQTNPAVFGGVDYVSESGLFVGAWASSVDFNDVADTYLELDLYAGYTHAFSDETSGTVKLVYYLYPTADYPPGSNEYDYLELVASLSHNFGAFTGGIELAYSPDFFFESDAGVALTGSASVPLTDSWWVFDGGVAASAKLGYQWIDANANFGTPDYLFYDIGLTAKISKFALDIRYVDSDLSEAECFGGTNLCEGKVVATLTLYLP